MPYITACLYANANTSLAHAFYFLAVFYELSKNLLQVDVHHVTGRPERMAINQLIHN